MWTKQHTKEKLSTYMYKHNTFDFACLLLHDKKINSSEPLIVYNRSRAIFKISMSLTKQALKFAVVDTGQP